VISSQAKQGIFQGDMTLLETTMGMSANLLVVMRLCSVRLHGTITGKPGDVDLAFLKAATRCLREDETFAYSERTFIQTGYGTVREVVENGTKKTLPVDTAGNNINGALQYRFASPLVSKTATVYEEKETQKQSYNQYLKAIQLKADVNDSTAPGDSGGPLFLIVKSKTDQEWKLFLLGVTIGADMKTSPTPCPGSNEWRVNNNAAYIDYIYTKWDTLFPS